MRRFSTKAVLTAAAFAALLAGCATTVEMGPGYYHWDTRPVHYSGYQAPAYVYHEPVIVQN
jgi:type IV pilus biogenesis protein CpaD/CtpE